MSAYTECSLHGYYDNDNGCPECQDAEDARIRQDERTTILDRANGIDRGKQIDGLLYVQFRDVLHAINPEVFPAE